MTQGAEINRRDALRLMGAGLGSLAAAISCSPRGNSSGANEAGSNSTLPNTAMLTKRIPSSGEMIPVIGLGTWQTFDAGASAAERQPLEEVLGAFSSLGGRLIDSSPMYGNSEDIAGDISAKLGLRQKLFVATKVWTESDAEVNSRSRMRWNGTVERSIYTRSITW